MTRFSSEKDNNLSTSGETRSGGRLYRMDRIVNSRDSAPHVRAESELRRHTHSPIELSQFPEGLLHESEPVPGRMTPEPSKLAGKSLTPVTTGVPSRNPVISAASRLTTPISSAGSLRGGKSS